MRYIKELEIRVARLEREAQRLRPNIQLANKILDQVMVRVKRAKHLSSLLFEKKMTLKDAHFAKHYDHFPSFKAIEEAIKKKDYEKIVGRSNSIRNRLDDSSDWHDIQTSFPYLLPAIIILGDLVRRDDVWGENGFRKFKLGWNKFKKEAEKCWREYQEIMQDFEDIQDEVLAGGVTLHFSYLLGRLGDRVVAQMNLQNGTLSVSLFELVKKSDRALRVTIEHELVHYEQHLQGISPSTPSDELKDYWIEHSLKDTEFDPRVNDVSNAVADLIEVGLSAKEAINLLTQGGRKPHSVDEHVFDQAQQWLSTLKHHDREKYNRALKEIEEDYL